METNDRGPEGLRRYTGSDGISRRMLLSRAGNAALGSVAFSGLGFGLIACGGDDESSSGGGQAAQSLTLTDVQNATGKLNVIGTATYQTPKAAPDGIQVEYGHVGTNEQTIQKTAQEGAFDVAILPNGNIDPLYVLERLEPIDTDLIENWDQINARFRDSDAIRRDGQVVAVPHHWGYTYNVYNTETVEPPETLEQLMSPKLRKRIAIPDDGYVAITAMAVIRGIEDANRLTQAQFDECCDDLRKLKPQLLSIFPYGEEGSLMGRGDVDVLFAASANSLQLAQGAGVKVDKTMLGAFCWWMAYGVLNGAANKAGAYKFVSNGLSLDVMNAVTKKSGALPVIDAGVSAVAPEFQYETADEVLEQAPFLPGVPVEADGDVVVFQDWLKAWEEIKA